MEIKRDFAIVLWVIILFGVFFLGRGITGNIILNTYSLSDSCKNDNDCTNNSICCITILEKGMCTTNEVCSQIKNEEIPLNKANYSFDIVFGIMILTMVLIIFFYHTKKENLNKKIKKISKKKKK